MMNRLKNLNKRPKNTDVSTIEEEISTLATRRTDIEARKAAAVKAADEAREQRKLALIDSSDTSIDQFNQEIARWDGDVATYESVVAEIEQMLIAAGERLLAAQSAELRAKNAALLEEIATSVEKHAKELEAVLKPVAAILAKIRMALPKDLAIYSQGARPDGREEKSGSASTREIVSALLAESIAHVAPYTFDDGVNFKRQSALFRVDISDAWPGVRIERSGAPAPASEAARLLVVDRLRQRAEAIREGEAPAEILGTPVYVPVVQQPETSVSIFVVKNFSYIKDELGRLSLVGKNSTIDIDVVLAKAAVERGFSLRLDTEEGKLAHDAHQESLKVYRPHNSSLTREDCEPLGNVFGFKLPDEPAGWELSSASPRGGRTPEAKTIKPELRIPEFSSDED
jgi:hypothetical protein